MILLIVTLLYIIHKKEIEKMTSKKELVDYYKVRLATNERWALRALERIAMRQTEYELENDLTNESNKVGFSGPDAEILTSFYRQVKRGYTLTSKQKVILFRKMPKYAGQLVSISIQEGKVIKVGSEYKFI